MKPTILLSIIIPNYNYAHFLEHAVRSIFQGEKPEAFFEIVIVDDASTDGSKELIEKLAKEFSCIRYLMHQTRQGVVKTCCDGFELSCGMYVHFFSADDLYLPGALAKILHSIRTFPEISIFSSENTFFSDPSEIQSIPFLPTATLQIFSKKQAFNLFKNTSLWMPGHTVFTKREMFLKYGPWDQKLEFVCDWYYNHKVALNEGFGYIPSRLVAFRKHPNSLSASCSKESRRQVWLYLLTLFEMGDVSANFYKTGIARMLGLKAIYKDLLRRPKYWKYALPMCRKIIKKKTFQILGINAEKRFLQQLVKSQ